MKAHIGVDAESGLDHSVVGTAANVSDVTQAGALLHGEEEAAFGDAGSRGMHKRDEAQGPSWHIALQPGKRRRLDPTNKWARLLERAEQLKASVRAKVEHPFHVIKNLFKHKKVRYKGLAKNEAQLFSLFGLANLVIARRQGGVHSALRMRALQSASNALSKMRVGPSESACRSGLQITSSCAGQESAW